MMMGLGFLHRTVVLCDELASAQRHAREQTQATVARRDEAERVESERGRCQERGRILCSILLKGRAADTDHFICGRIVTRAK